MHLGLAWRRFNVRGPHAGWISTSALDRFSRWSDGDPPKRSADAAVWSAWCLARNRAMVRYDTRSMRALDLPSHRDVPEHLPGGAVWWTRHTAEGPEHVLELPADDDATALELLLLAVDGGRTTWLWRGAWGAVLACIEGAQA